MEGRSCGRACPFTVVEHASTVDARQVAKTVRLNPGEVYIINRAP